MASPSAPAASANDLPLIPTRNGGESGGKKAGGTVTGEHGVGMGKLHMMEAEHGIAWGVMAELKAALDPFDILNPVKIVRRGENA